MSDKIKLCCDNPDYQFVRNEERQPKGQMKFWLDIYQCANCGYKKKLVAEEPQKPKITIK